jgi:hypothetical protein
MLFPVTALHEDEVLLEVLEPFIRGHVDNTLLDYATNSKIFIVKLVETYLFLQQLFYFLLSILQISLEMVDGGLNLLNDIHREISREKTLHTLVHEF